MPWRIRLSPAAMMDSLAGRGSQPSSCLALSALGELAGAAADFQDRGSGGEGGGGGDELYDA